MSNSNGIITAPVTIDDLKTVLGDSSNDLATLCEHPGIKMFAKWKPIGMVSYGEDDVPTRLSAVQYSTVRYGIKIPTTRLSVTALVSGGPAIQWQYCRPVAGREYHRIADFVNVADDADLSSHPGGYDHGAGNPISMDFPSSITSNRTTDRNTFFSVIFSFGIGINPATRLNLEDIFNQEIQLGELYYPGIIVGCNPPGSDSWIYFAKTLPAGHDLVTIYNNRASSGIITVNLGELAYGYNNCGTWSSPWTMKIYAALFRTSCVENVLYIGTDSVLQYSYELRSLMYNLDADRQALTVSIQGEDDRPMLYIHWSEDSVTAAGYYNLKFNIYLQRCTSAATHFYISQLRVVRPSTGDINVYNLTSSQYVNIPQYETTPDSPVSAITPSSIQETLRQGDIVLPVISSLSPSTWPYSINGISLT